MPPTNFFSLPSELRNEIYMQALVIDEPIAFYKPVPKTSATNLLLVSKAVHDEATPLFYQQNCFRLKNWSFETSQWLEEIGDKNAGYIRHWHVPFPEFIVKDPTSDAPCVRFFDDEWIDYLLRLCGDLRTITFDASSSLDNYPDSFLDAVLLLDSRLKVLSPHLKITVEIYDYWMCERLQEVLGSCGWTIKEECVLFVSDEGSEEDDADPNNYYDYSESNDENDVDHSGFENATAD